MKLTGKGWLECPATGALTELSQEITVAAWVTRGTVIQNYRALVTRQLDVGRQDEFMFGFANGQLLFASHVWKGRLMRPLPPGLERWFHVAVTRRQDGLVVLFVNGTEIGRGQTRPGRLPGAGNPLIIGAAVNGWDPTRTEARFDGAIDDLAIHDGPGGRQRLRRWSPGADPVPALSASAAISASGPNEPGGIPAQRKFRNPCSRSTIPIDAFHPSIDSGHGLDCRGVRRRQVARRRFSRWGRAGGRPGGDRRGGTGGSRSGGTGGPGTGGKGGSAGTPDAGSATTPDANGGAKVDASTGTGGTVGADGGSATTADASTGTGGSTDGGSAIADSNTPMNVDGAPLPSYEGEIPIYYGPPVGPIVQMDCPGDPTQGWTEYQDSFKVQRPYNRPINTRFSITGGIYNFWVFPNDFPHSPDAGGRNPRTEARYGGTADKATGNNFQSGMRMYSVDMLIERNAVGSAIMQIHARTPRSPSACASCRTATWSTTAP